MDRISKMDGADRRGDRRHCSAALGWFVFVALSLLAALATDGSLLAATIPSPVVSADFEKSFAPFVVRNCVSCHNASDPKGGLDLTHREAVLKGGDSGPALVPGNPDGSYLLQRVRKGEMPPPG